MAWRAALAPHPDGTLLHAMVVPGAGRDAITGYDPWRRRLRLRVAAPPVEGAANERALRFLAEALGVPPQQLALATGAQERRKSVLVRALAPPEVARRLAPFLERP